jgi:hypothetical protein
LSSKCSIRYSTVRGPEQREGIAKVVDLMRPGGRRTPLARVLDPF